MARNSNGRVEFFRNPRPVARLHGAEKSLVGVLVVQLCFLPWALGTMRPWGQAVSLALAALGLGIALVPRSYEGNPGVGAAPFRLTMWPRLMRFPIFWLGLGLLVLVVVQGSNPSWRFMRSPRVWWLDRETNIGWLPTSVEAPFARFNSWRKLIVFSGSWLMVCSVWVGLTRRRSLRILLGVIGANALALGGLLALEHLRGSGHIPDPMAGWVPEYLDASFTYKNHAGAYLALAVFAALALGAWFLDHGRRSASKSTPAGVLALEAAFIAGAVLFTSSRGATLTMGLGLLVFAVWLLVRLRVHPAGGGMNPALVRAFVALFLIFAVVAFHFLDFSEITRGLDRLAVQNTHEADVRSRLMADDASVDMLKANWVRGVGAGDFQYRYPFYLRYYPTIFGHGDLFWEHAHCDWLETPIELGLVGDLLILCGAIWWIRRFVRWRTLWHPAAAPLLIGCAQTLVHAGFDFPFECPAIMATWCVLIAIAGRWGEIDCANPEPKD